jgi:hypothetical protein
LLPLFFTLVGASRWRAGHDIAAAVVWSVGLVVSVAAIVSAGARRRIYLGWMRAVAPIGWVVSHLLLAAIWILVAIPTALVLRLAGRDPMQRRFDRSASTYWVRRPPDSDRTRYFRQS